MQTVSSGHLGFFNKWLKWNHLMRHQLFCIWMICIWCFNIFPTKCLKCCCPLCLGKASFLFYQGELAQCTGFINTFIREAAHQGLWDRMLPECQQSLNNACPCRDSFSRLRREGFREPHISAFSTSNVLFFTNFYLHNLRLHTGQHTEHQLISLDGTPSQSMKIYNLVSSIQRKWLEWDL